MVKWFKASQNVWTPLQTHTILIYAAGKLYRIHADLKKVVMVFRYKMGGKKPILKRSEYLLRFYSDMNPSSCSSLVDLSMLWLSRFYVTFGDFEFITHNMWATHFPNIDICLKEWAIWSCTISFGGYYKYKWRHYANKAIFYFCPCF